MLVSMTLALGALASPALAGETTVTLAVRNWYCAACPHVIKAKPRGCSGRLNVTVSDKTKTASVTFEDTKTDVKSLTQATAEAGYPSFPSYGRDAVAVKDRALIISGAAGAVLAAACCGAPVRPGRDRLCRLTKAARGQALPAAIN
jgi:mercuric ion binding protein